MRTEWVLAAGAVLLSLVAIEGMLRAVDALTSHDLSELPADTATTPRHGSLALGDIIRRARSRDLAYELRPGVRGTFMDAALKINSHGFRGPSVPEVPRDGAIRVVGIGDSMAFGWGVDDKDTFLMYLKRRFHRDYPNAPPLEIVNLAVPGYNTNQEVEAFLTKGLTYQPHLVVLYLCGNDDQLPNFVWKRDPYTLRRSYLFDFLSERWALLTAGTISSSLRHTSKVSDGRAMLRSIDPSRVPRFYRRMVGIDSVVRALARLQSITHARGIPVIYAGWRSDLDDRIVPVARSLGFTMVDGVPARTQRFLDASGRTYQSLLVSPSDGHPNREFHALIGAAIYEEAFLPWYRARRAGDPGEDQTAGRPDPGS